MLENTHHIIVRARTRASSIKGQDQNTAQLLDTLALQLDHHFQFWLGAVRRTTAISHVLQNRHDIDSQLILNWLENDDPIVWIVGGLGGQQGVLPLQVSND